MQKSLRMKWKLHSKQRQICFLHSTGQSFSIAREELVHFIQASGSSSVFNQVTGNQGSEILGSLLSNGAVYLINPNGILIGPDAKIETAGFLASTLDLFKGDLENKTLQFTGESERESSTKGRSAAQVEIFSSLLAR